MSALSRFVLSLMTAAAVATPATFVNAANHAEPTSQIHPVKGFLPDLRFELTAADHQTVTAEQFKDKTVLMFFGYANCPDICPTTMVQLAEVVDQLGAEGDQVQIVFVSVDPHRDTPEILDAYVKAFDTNAIGLTGTEKQIADLARRYRVAYQIEAPAADSPNYYEVAHSRGVYVFDAKGKARYLASDSESVEALVEVVRDVL